MLFQPIDIFVVRMWARNGPDEATKLLVMGDTKKQFCQIARQGQNETLSSPADSPSTTATCCLGQCCYKFQ